LWGDLTAKRQSEAQRQLALLQLEALQQAAPFEHSNSAVHPSGLHTSDQFQDQVRREVDLANREHREFALVSVALDPLPIEIVQLGLGAKARILEALSRLLRSNTRAMDSSCETQEGCFQVLLSGVGLATAHSRMESLRRQCATQIVMFDGHDLRFSVSIGVASFPHTARDQDALQSASGQALLQAQKRGTSNVALASIRFEFKPVVFAEST
jgi:diguanylate cyclase (GGDEF)-like protein